MLLLVFFVSHAEFLLLDGFFRIQFLSRESAFQGIDVLLKWAMTNNTNRSLVLHVRVWCASFPVEWFDLSNFVRWLSTLLSNVGFLVCWSVLDPSSLPYVSVSSVDFHRPTKPLANDDHDHFSGSIDERSLDEEGKERSPTFSRSSWMVFCKTSFFRSRSWTFSFKRRWNSKLSFSSRWSFPWKLNRSYRQFRW